MNDDKLASLIGQRTFDLIKRFGGQEKIEWLKEKVRAAIQRAAENPHIAKEQLIDEFHKSVAPLISDVVTEMLLMGELESAPTSTQAKGPLLH